MFLFLQRIYYLIFTDLNCSINSNHYSPVEICLKKLVFIYQNRSYCTKLRSIKLLVLGDVGIPHIFLKEVTRLKLYRNIIVDVAYKAFF
ncbi:uncharacterized protein RNJ42_03464 [Nakaseomyces bracarensis]|uniref:uncharacterized protein n=1 Tax=Nakaseomyces bracarensis TaxID=273131 RepID=UPI003871B379